MNRSMLACTVRPLLRSSLEENLWEAIGHMNEAFR